MTSFNQVLLTTQTRAKMARQVQYRSTELFPLPESNFNVTN